MTRLSLHHADENPNLSIHLREGQYCTVGSSAAADYSFRANGVEPVHCRIGCLASGGFIECFDVSHSIQVNNVRKERSRLLSGDSLRIGTVEWRVEFPDQLKPATNFAVEFDSEDAETTKVVDEWDLDSPETSDESSESDAPDATSTNTDSTSTNTDATSTNTDATSTNTALTPAEDTNVDSHGGAKATRVPVASPAMPPDRLGSIVKPAEQRPHPIEDRPRFPKDDSKPLFQFDSAEPADLEISHAEFEALSRPEEGSVTLGSVDLESELPTTDRLESNERSSQPEDVETDVAGQAFRGGAFLGKYWRWNGEQAIAAIRQLVEIPESIHVYRSNVNQISVDAFDEISLSRLITEQPAVYLISALSFQELQQLIRQKRWADRLGHPQAVTMFLTFLPKRILTDFFDAIDACVLVHENDVELIRIRKAY